MSYYEDMHDSHLCLRDKVVEEANPNLHGRHRPLSHRNQHPK